MAKMTHLFVKISLKHKPCYFGKISENLRALMRAQASFAL